MANGLWTWEALVTACDASPEGSAKDAIAGFSIDTRTIDPGEVFVALKDKRDGHEFVTSAFKAEAAAALVSHGYAKRPGDGALIRVRDPLKGLEAIGRAARSRLAPEARVIGVTGSAGKTGTKEMLRACLARLGATHASEKSYNNHWGVPLTLARMPAETQFAVLEIGMNHAGEIAPLARLVRPNVAIITTVEPVHLGFFASVEEIADAKAEIFSGLEPGGTAVLSRDNPHFERLKARALSQGARVLSFGRHGQADVRLERLELGPSGSKVGVTLGGRTIAYGLGVPGEHIVQNSLAVIAGLHAIGADVETVIGALAKLEAPPGRGARATLSAPGGAVLIIDESYNANPASMRAALATLALVPREAYPRRIAVLGDMLELGGQARALHMALKPAIEAAGVDLVFAAGPNMQALYQMLEPGRRGDWAETSERLTASLLARVKAGDAVMIKGSLGSRMVLLVEALARRFPADARRSSSL